MTDTLKAFTEAARGWIDINLKGHAISEKIDELVEDFERRAEETVFNAVGAAQEDLYRTVRLTLEPTHKDGLQIHYWFWNYEDIPALKFPFSELVARYAETWEPDETTIGAIDKAIEQLQAARGKLLKTSAESSTA